MERINDNDSIGYADFIHIIFGEKHIEYFPHEEKALSTTFAEIMDIAIENGYSRSEHGVIIMIAENPLSGKVFVYGNYGEEWSERGTTMGYA